MKKLYLVGLTALISGGAMAQSLKDKEVAKPALQPMNESEMYDAETQELMDARNERARKSMEAFRKGTLRPNTKAPEDTIAYFSFDNGLDGWTNDDVNYPPSVNPGFAWEWGTVIDAGIFGAPAVESATPDNGFATFNVGAQAPVVNGGYITEECWAGLKSPSIDLSAFAAEKDDLILSFYDVYRHCCSNDLAIAIDVSTDGGATFPLTQRINIIGLPVDTSALEPRERNLTSGGNNFTIAPLGRVLEDVTDLSQIAFRFTWDSSSGDANGQTSDVYYWAVDDVTLMVAPQTDLKITAAYYGDAINEFDYRRIPQDFLQGGYGVQATVKNDGSQASSFELVAEFTNAATGEVKMYRSGATTINRFDIETFYVNAFDDYVAGTTDFTGEWALRYWVESDGDDFLTDFRDTAATVPLFITYNEWAHARPWNGDTLQSQEKFDDGTRPATPYAQRFIVPNNLTSVTVSDMAWALHDDLGEVPIGIPNQVEFSLDTGSTQGAWSNASPRWFYYNEDEGEVDGLAFIDGSNRDRRLVQLADNPGAAPFPTPDMISGELFSSLNGVTEEVTLQRGPSTTPGAGIQWITRMQPSETMNMAAAGREEDNATIFFGPFGGGGSNWFSQGPTDAVPIAVLTVTAINGNPVGVNELANENLGFTLEQNKPNPFNGSTKIAYNLERAGNVSLSIMDVTGKVVNTIAPSFQSAGNHDVTISADNLNNGIYFYTFTLDGKSITKKMIVNK